MILIGDKLWILSIFDLYVYSLKDFSCCFKVRKTDHICSINKITENVVAFSLRSGDIKLANLGDRSVKTLSGHTDFVTSCLKLYDGRLVSCSEDHSVRVWTLSPEIKRWMSINQIEGK